MDLIDGTGMNAASLRTFWLQRLGITGPTHAIACQAGGGFAAVRDELTHRCDNRGGHVRSCSVRHVCPVNPMGWVGTVSLIASPALGWQALSATVQAGAARLAQGAARHRRARSWAGHG